MVDTFKKCDMHVHSSSCFSRDYTEKEFLNHLIESDLEVVAITDHNSLDVQLLETIHKKFAPIGKIVLPGVELNVKLRDKTIEKYDLVLGHGKAGEYFHGIVWCSYENRDRLCKIVDSLFIEEGCISEDDLKNIDSGTVSRKEISRKTDAHAVFLERVQEELADIPYFFVFHENKGARNLSDYLPNADDEGNLIESNLEYKDRLFYYSHAMAVEGGETSRSRISAGMKEDLNTTLAALFFSDALKLDAIGAKYTWIDFDGDLDSLLLAISDPESRIITSDVCSSNPQENKDYYLESITFDTVDEKGNLNSHVIDLSPGLNGVVGSRGSGKSMLAHAVAHKELETYSGIIKPESIRYKTTHSEFTQKVPNYLYLKQGELEDLFNSGSYEKVPFLQNKLTKLEMDAKETADIASSSICVLLDKEGLLVKEYLDLYSTGPLTMDALNEEPPSGLLIEFPVYTPTSDAAMINQLDEDLEEINTAAEKLQGKITSLEVSTEHEEVRPLFDAINQQSSHLKEHIALLTSEIDALSKKIKLIDREWFTTRNSLKKVFSQTKKQFNNKQDTASLSNYGLQKEELANYFENLLKLRLIIAEIDKRIAEEQSRLKAPITPIEEKVDAETITINIEYSGLNSLDESVSSLVSISPKTQENLIARASLYASEPLKAHKLFKGNRIKQIQNGQTESYVAKYLETLRKELVEGHSIEKTISLNGIGFEEMSPGMRAEALLKLFLNDRIADQELLLVILDQPEDNLDTDTISKFLIPRLKKLKTKIQIIVVSHSAPIVINGDARSLVLCRVANKSFSYSVGSINNKKIKKDISSVLDGGERYLKMRLNKYNFQIGV